MTNIILSVKLKNQLRKRGNFDFFLENTRINGEYRGCTGFVVNPANGVVFYGVYA